MRVRIIMMMIIIIMIIGKDIRIIKNDHCKDKIFAQAPEEHSEGSLCWEEQQEVSRRDRGAFLLDAILVICLSAF